MMFSLIPPFGIRTNTGRPWKLPSRSPLPPSPHTGPSNLYAPLLGLPLSWRPEKTVPSRLMRNRAGPDGLLTLFDCRHCGWTLPGGVGSARLLGLGHAVSGKIASTAACVGLLGLAAPPGAVAGKLAWGSLVNHVALPNAKPPPGVAGFAMSATRQSRCHVNSFVRVLRSMPNITLPRSLAELTPKRPEIVVVWLPPCCVSPKRASTDAPSKLSFRMKLTTPPTASAPYTADAPPEMTSTREMADEGIEFTSTTIVGLIGIPRLPLISTRFRFGPRPRRLTVAAPTVLVAVFCTSPVVNWVTAGTNCGILFRTVSTPIKLVCSNAC